MDGIFLAMLQELQAIRIGLDKLTASKAKRRSSSVNNSVAQLLAMFPENDWTSLQFANAIGSGCTSAAVRQTKQWKAYQQHRKCCKAEQIQKRKRVYECYDHFAEIDEKIDSEM